MLPRLSLVERAAPHAWWEASSCARRVGVAASLVLFVREPGRSTACQVEPRSTSGAVRRPRGPAPVSSRRGWPKGVGSWLASAALECPRFGAFFGLFETVGLTLDGEDLGVMDEAIDQGDDAGGVGEDLAPFRERPV